MESRMAIMLGTLIGLVTVAVLAWLVFRRPNSSDFKPLVTDSDSLAKVLNKVRAQYGLPALAAGFIQGSNIINASVGSCLHGVDQRVNEESRFHIGSTTKSMTSLLIAILVNEGKLRYNMSLAEALPGVIMLEAYRDVTLHDLLLNRGGIIAFQKTDLEDPGIVKRLWEEIPAVYGDPMQQRKEVTAIALNLTPIVVPGTKAIYSNVGWAIAGHIAELASIQSYESLAYDRIFKPLGMNSARIGGWPASIADPDQPRGHYPPAANNKGPTPQELEDPYVFPDWMNPSGGVHCTIADFARYAREHLKGLQGQGTLLPQEGYRIIHSSHATVDLREMYLGTTPGGTMNFGYGWGIIPVEGSDLSAADGSGGTFYARILVYPALNVAFVGLTNCGTGSPALDAAIEGITGFEWNSGS